MGEDNSYFYMTLCNLLTTMESLLQEDCKLFVSNNADRLPSVGSSQAIGLAVKQQQSQQRSTLLDRQICRV
jgi:hypothetical protein